jgi:transposase, IS4 family
VKTQIRITVSVYVPVALIKKRLKIEASLYNILQVLSRSLFEKYTLIQLLDKSNNTSIAIEDSFQLNLFDNLLGH